MITIYVGEERDGRTKFTTDRDCLSPQIIRFDERVFPNLEAVKTAAAKLEDRGFAVCIDTEDCFYETPDTPVVKPGTGPTAMYRRGSIL